MRVEEAERVRDSACTGKIAYGVSGAKDVASRLSSETPMAAYRCPFCGAWHVGHALSVEGMRVLADAIRTLAGDGPGAPSGTLSKAERRRLRRAAGRNPVAGPNRSR